MGILLAIITLGIHSPTPRPFWDGHEWTCPVRWSAYAIESRAMAGKKNFVVCVKEKLIPGNSVLPTHSVEQEDSLHQNTIGKESY